MKTILVLITFVWGCKVGDAEISPCATDDNDCINNLAQLFIKSVINGAPETNVSSIDPLVISSIDFDNSKGVIFHLSNVTVTGLASADIVADVNMANQLTKLKLKLDMTVTANMEIEFTDINKSIRNIKYRTKPESLIMRTRYAWKIAPNAEGVKYFYILEETNACNITGDPEVQLDADLETILSEDPQLLEKLGGLNKNESRGWKTQIICKIADKTISEMVANVRYVSNKPVSLYLKDV